MASESPEDIKRREAELRRALYPELEKEELSEFVRRLVGQAGFSIDSNATDPLRVADRYASISRAALERLFLFELWSKGVCYGSGKTAEPQLMAEAIGVFVIARATVDEMSRRFPWVELRRAARPHEAGRLVDESWRWLQERSDPVGELLLPLVRECEHRPRLRRLLPFTSHEMLLFSRTTGYPYDAMVACARPVYDPNSKADRYVEKFVPGRFEVLLRPRVPIAPATDAPQSLGTGDAAWAARVVEQHVPPAWDGAVDGTADDEV